MKSDSQLYTLPPLLPFLSHTPLWTDGWRYQILMKAKMGQTETYVQYIPTSSHMSAHTLSLQTDLILFIRCVS